MPRTLLLVHRRVVFKIFLFIYFSKYLRIIWILLPNNPRFIKKISKSDLRNWYRIILKNISENFENLVVSKNLKNCYGKFGELFHKIFWNIWENFENHIKNFRNILRNTSDIFEKYFFEQYFLKKKSLDNFKKHFEISKIFQKIWRNISEKF